MFLPTYCFPWKSNNSLTFKSVENFQTNISFFDGGIKGEIEKDLPTETSTFLNVNKADALLLFGIGVLECGQKLSSLRKILIK